MISYYILLIAGIFLLVKGSNYLIDGASNVGKYLKIKPIIIGLTLLAFGTSLPELAINIFSALKGATDINLGNIIGASIANLLLILGVSCLIITIKVKHSIVKRGIPFTIFSILLLLLLVNDSILNGSNLLSRFDGIILLICFGVFVYYVYMLGKKDKELIPEELDPPKSSKFATTMMILAGIAALFIGGKLVTDAAVEIARTLSVSEFLISATVISVGSTLPELFVSVTAALKKNLDFVVGNIVGSNIFNILFILGISAIINPIPFNAMFNFDLIFLFAITSVLITFMYAGRKKHELERWNSYIFLGLYVFYITFLIARG